MNQQRKKTSNSWFRKGCCRLFPCLIKVYCLTHWGRVTHLCVNKSTIIASDNGLLPERRQAIIWTNAGILKIGLLRTNFNEILMEIQTFSFRKMHLKRSSAKWRPSCLGLNVLDFKTNCQHSELMKILFISSFLWVCWWAGAARCQNICRNIVDAPWRLRLQSET